MQKCYNIKLLTILVIAILLSAVPVYGQDRPAQPTSPDLPIIEQYYNWLEAGRAALPELKQAIKSSNWRMRTHGLLAMGKTGDPALTQLVIDRLQNDPHPAVKNCAVMALGDLKDNSAVPVLLDLLSQTRDPGKLKHLPQQRLIVQSLGKTGDARAIVPLYELLTSNSSESLRGDITEALIAINDPAVSRLILKDQPGDRPFPYIQAAQIMGALPVDGTEGFLISLAQKNALPVQNSAVIALGTIRSKKSVPHLLTLFDTDNRLIQKNTADALINIDAPAATIPLCELMSSPDPETAMAAAMVLARMTDPSIGAAVYDRFLSSHKINAPAAVVLGQKKVRTAAPELRARLKTERESGQDEMAEALGRLADQDAIPLLLDVASRKSGQGSAGAIWSLGHLKEKKAIPLLLSIIKKQDRRLTGPAVFALGEIGDPKTVKPLINLYYESGFQYQMQVALALAQIGGPEVADILKTNMESRHPKRQKMAGYILLKSHDPSLVPYAISLLNHPDETIRRYALGGLKNITGKDFDTKKQWQAWETQLKK